MKQKFSSLFVLLVLLLTGLQVSAQSTPKPFDIEQPSLRVFLPAPELATGRAVVACPGGGYSGLAVNHEGYDWAPYFNKQGFALFVLKYRMPKGDRTLPISDAEAAMKMVRDSADVWNLNPNDIGIMGSSAGGHLALSLGVHWDKEWLSGPLGLTPEQIRPNGLILCYPVVTAGEGCHRGSVERLLWGQMLTEEEQMIPERGTEEKEMLRELISLEKQVGSHTPPVFLWHTVTDQTVPVRNALILAEALIKSGVSLELHLYPVGRHGLALATEETADGQESNIEPQCQSWIVLAEKWLEHF